MIRKTYKIIIYLILLFIIGCSSEKSTVSENYKLENDAKRVVVDFFNYYGNKEVKKMESLLIEGRKGVTWEIEKLESVKLLKIEENKSEKEKNSFMTYGLGSTLRPYDVKIFNTIFDIKYKGGLGSGMDNGRYDWKYIVVKEKKDSQWRIADWGI